MNTPKSTFLYQSCNMQAFFNLGDIEILRWIHLEFTEELDRLKRAYSIRDRDMPTPSRPSPSYILYGAQHDEVNRTLVSVLCLRWIYNDQYEIFKGTQPEHLALSQETFQWLRNFLLQRLQDPPALYALLTSIIINDLGKDGQLASDYFSLTGHDITNDNHDMILFKAAKVGLIPCFDRLQEDHKDELLCGLQLAGVFNPGQLAQAENAPACLSSLLSMKGQIKSFEFHFMQQLLDIAGAAGHEDWVSAKKLTEPIAKVYKDVYEVAIDIILGNQTLRGAYDTILTNRGTLLHGKGLRMLDVRYPDQRALLRLLCMGGATDLEQAHLYLSVWNDLDESIRGFLISSLNIDGSALEPAVQPTYMPAMLTQGIDGTSPQEDQAKGLNYMLRYLSRVMTISPGHHAHAAVIERSVLWVVKDVIQSTTFLQDPTILETTAVPKSSVLVSV